MIGQELLERGFPRDASSSELVLVYERKNGRLTPDDFAFRGRRGLEPLPVRPGASGTRGQSDRHAPLARDRSAVDRFQRRWSRSGGAVDRLAEQHPSLPEDAGRGRPDPGMAQHGASPRRRRGSIGRSPGSAVVGHDTNTATDESIQNTTNTTIVLVILILLVVYRSPLLAMVPLVTIALSVFVSLRLIALLTKVPGLGFQVINITQIFVVVVLFGAGTDYCLFLVARYWEELGRGRSRVEALREAIGQVGAALVASAGTVIVGLGMLWFSSFAMFQYTGPTIALSLAVALVAALTLAPAMLAWLRAALFWPFRAPHHEDGQGSRDRESRGAPADGLLGRGRRPGRQPSPDDPRGLPGGPGSPGRGGCPRQVELQPARRPRPGSAERGRCRCGPALLRRRRAESDRGPGREPHPGFPLAAGQGRDRGDQPPAGGRSATSPRSAR